MWVIWDQNCGWLTDTWLHKSFTLIFFFFSFFTNEPRGVNFKLKTCRSSVDFEGFSDCHPVLLWNSGHWLFWCGPLCSFGVKNVKQELCISPWRRTSCWCGRPPTTWRCENWAAGYFPGYYPLSHLHQEESKSVICQHNTVHITVATSTHTKASLNLVQVQWAQDH